MEVDNHVVYHVWDHRHQWVGCRPCGGTCHDRGIPRSNVVGHEIVAFRWASADHLQIVSGESTGVDQLVVEQQIGAMLLHGMQVAGRDLAHH